MSRVCLDLLTVALLPEPKGKSLEELTADAEAAGDVGARPPDFEPAVA